MRHVRAVPLVRWPPAFLAGEEVDVVVASGRRGKHHAVWMEGRGGDGLATVREESTVWLHVREEGAGEVEDFHRVMRGTTVAGGRG